MHVAQLGFLPNPNSGDPEALLDEWPALSALAEAVTSAGVTVSVIQASGFAARVERAGVVYEFVAPERPGQRITLSKAFQVVLKRLDPDVLHIHGLRFAREVLDLKKYLPEIPLFLQDHAERLPRLWRRYLWRRAARGVSAVSFCAREQAQPFLRAGLLRPDTKIFEIPEAPAAFTPGDQAAARAATGIDGSPAILAVSHLNDNKDPLTVLDGVSAAVSELPNLKLWWCFATAPRLSAVEARIRRDSRLRERVRLLGRVPHARIEQLMRAADLFVLGSHREGGSFALMEALATGLAPVVTDIPANRSMTGDGRIGALWASGDPASLSLALIAAAAEADQASRSRIVSHFRAELSADAIGRRFAAAYRQLTGCVPAPPGE